MTCRWADGATLRLLERVAPEARRLPMLVVAMHRDSGGRLTAGIDRASRRSAEPAAAHAERGRLGAVRRCGGGRPRCRAPAAGLSGGSPLYLVTLARVAAEQLRGRASWGDAVSTQFGQSTTLGAGTVFYAGSVARILGELDLGCGEHAAAVPHFEEGLRVDSMLGARPYLAWGRLGLACAQGVSRDRARVAELARAAAAEARLLDMPGLLRAADAFLAAAAEARAEDPLTPREREVAGLVAQALSNRGSRARSCCLSAR